MYDFLDVCLIRQNFWQSPVQVGKMVYVATRVLTPENQKLKHRVMVCDSNGQWTIRSGMPASTLASSVVKWLFVVRQSRLQLIQNDS